MHRMHQMFVEIEGAVCPKRLTGLCLDKLIMKDKACKHRAKREQRQRRQHRPWAFMGMIARRPVTCRRVRMRIMVMVMGVVTIIMHRVLNMLRLLPTWLAEEGKEHQPPAVKARQKRSDHTNRKAVHMIG